MYRSVVHVVLFIYNLSKANWPGIGLYMIHVNLVYKAFELYYSQACINSIPLSSCVETKKPNELECTCQDPIKDLDMWVHVTISMASQVFYIQSIINNLTFLQSFDFGGFFFESHRTPDPEPMMCALHFCKRYVLLFLFNNIFTRFGGYKSF